MDEEKLILEVKNNPIRFQELYGLWAVRIYQFVYARVNNRQDAEDLTAQIFMNAYQAMPRYRHEGTFSAWLFTIARNQIRSFFRK